MLVVMLKQKLQNAKKLGFVRSASLQRRESRKRRKVQWYVLNVCSEIVKKIIKEENENYLDYIFKNRKLTSFDLKNIENYDKSE